MSKKKTGPAIILALFIITCFSWGIGKGYKNDSIPFKKQLIALNNAIDLFLFRVSANEEVILGKENWLYYHWAGGDSNPEGEAELRLFFGGRAGCDCRELCEAERIFGVTR